MTRSSARVAADGSLADFISIAADARVEVASSRLELRLRHDAKLPTTPTQKCCSPPPHRRRHPSRLRAHPPRALRRRELARELLQEITTTIAVHQLHLSISANGASATGNLTRLSDATTTALDATITYDIDSKAAMLRWRVASAEWAGLIVADSPEKLFVHGPEGELLELKLDAEPEAPEADAGPSPPSAGSLSDEPSAHLSAADAPAVPLPPRGAFVYLQDVSSGECVVPRAPTDPELSVGAAPVGFGACAPATASFEVVKGKTASQRGLRAPSGGCLARACYTGDAKPLALGGCGGCGTARWELRADGALFQAASFGRSTNRCCVRRAANESAAVVDASEAAAAAMTPASSAAAPAASRRTRAPTATRCGCACGRRRRAAVCHGSRRATFRRALGEIVASAQRLAPKVGEDARRGRRACEGGGGLRGEAERAAQGFDGGGERADGAARRAGGDGGRARPVERERGARGTLASAKAEALATRRAACWLVKAEGALARARPTPTRPLRRAMRSPPAACECVAHGGERRGGGGAAVEARQSVGT